MQLHCKREGGGAEVTVPPEQKRPQQTLSTGYSLVGTADPSTGYRYNRSFFVGNWRPWGGCKYGV